MKRLFISLLTALTAVLPGAAQSIVPRCASEDKDTLMSEKYWNLWNDDAQKKIDADIEKNRKADAVVRLRGARKGTDIRIEQISSDFLFGANSFMFDQLGSDEKNGKYRDVFGSLFNAATVAFYWRDLEPAEGQPRFAEDSPFMYRRPSTDLVVNYMEKRGVNMNGHNLIWGFRKLGHPDWLPEDRKGMEPYFEKHIRQIADRYGKRLQRWDVVNEAYDQANRGLMPDDYVFKSYSWAAKYFPKGVRFNTNECDMQWGPVKRYTVMVRDLIERGVRIDCMGVQCHVQNVNGIRNGADQLSPQKIYDVLDCMAEAGRPVHISEVTMGAPEDSERGRLIQAEVVRNLYRIWFSYPDSMGITWWNMVDGSAFGSESRISGLFDKDMNPQPAYYVLDELINHEWRTDLTVKADADGTVNFRGFKGTYRISWTDEKGVHSFEYHLK